MWILYFSFFYFKRKNINMNQDITMQPIDVAMIKEDLYQDNKEN